jgi:hypothetical protein
MLGKTDVRQLSESKEGSLISRKINEFIDLLQEYNQHRLMPRQEKDYMFLRNFFHLFIEDQNRRAKEVASKDYQNILKLAKRQFPHKPYWVLCVDGRVLVILAYGATADIDDSVRVPGGMLREFVRGTDGKMFLRSESNFARLLVKALNSSSTGRIIEIFDSHIGCAARLVEEQGKGKYPKDSGLLADVHHKKQMVTATQKFVKEHFSDKHVICIQTSFDPHTGFLYMGLETPRAMEYATARGREYTTEILSQLSAKGLIISTEQISSEPEVYKILQKFDFKLAWKHAYVQSAVKFWTNVSRMKKLLFPILKNRLIAIYPYLASSDELSREELETRLILLLLNIYSGFLENVHPEIEHKQLNLADAHQYAYGVHEEEGMKVTEGGFPPYEISMFTVFSLDEVNLPANIELACSLVRNNQKEGRVKDRFGIFSNPIEFAHSPVPVVMQEIVRDERIGGEDWQSLFKIDWSDLPQIPWERMSREEFDEYLQTKGKIQQSLALSIQRLRHKMQIVWDPDHAISHHLINQDEVILPILSDRGRYIHAVIPFVKLGYQE